MTQQRFRGLVIGPFVFGRSTPITARSGRPRFFIGWIVVALIATGSIPMGIALAIGLAIVHVTYLVAEAVADTDDTENQP